MKRGRGHTKAEQTGLDRTVSQDHGVPVIYLPKIFRELGVKLGQEITLDFTSGNNPMAWEIKIKPKTKKEQEEAA